MMPRKTRMSKKIITILGPTGSGKSEIATNLAKRFNGEVISADSRQVYKGMDIGTGKILKKEMKGIPHHLLNVVSPKKKFNVVQYRKLAMKAIEKIFKKGKVPIICGGTGFYIQAVIDGIIMPLVNPDYRLRSRLNQLTTVELFKKLKELDPKRAKTIDRNNRRRLIRALEIVMKTKKPVPELKKNSLSYPVLMIGTRPKEKNVIIKRINKMIKQGLEKEVKNLVKQYGWTTDLQTIGYQEWKEYFENKISKNKVRDLIILHTKQYAKRQMTWFKRDERIHWIKNYKEAKKTVKGFL